MSVTIKVQFEDKLFKLSQGVTSIQQVNEEMRKRYPNSSLEFEYLFEGQEVKDLKNLLLSYERIGKTSLKLTAVSAASSRKQSECSLISIASDDKRIEE